MGPVGVGCQVSAWVDLGSVRSFSLPVGLILLFGEFVILPMSLVLFLCAYFVSAAKPHRKRISFCPWHRSHFHLHICFNFFPRHAAK